MKQLRNVGADVRRLENSTEGGSETPHVVSYRGLKAFTLVELLVVIAIIALLAAMVVPLASTAMGKARVSRLNAELQRYVMAIENYKLEVGEYPPDNPKLKTLSTDPKNDTNWANYAAHSPLYYELSGAVFTNKAGKNVFIVIDSNEEIDPASLSSQLGVDGIRNSARDRHDRPYKGFSFRESDHRKLYGVNIDLLAVAVPGPFMIDGTSPNNPNAKVKFNPWRYDASSTNRHNKRSFDLWTEIIIGSSTNLIGNWKS